MINPEKKNSFCSCASVGTLETKTLFLIGEKSGFFVVR